MTHVASISPQFVFHLGDALAILRTLPTASVHSIVCSPPYFNLRDYDQPGQIGREKSAGAFIDALVAVFAEAKRVLRKDGTLFINIGDSYHNKQLQMIPARLAIALQADGWILRAECVWDKPNCAPESVKDRPSRSHEYVFLFSRSPRYFYDREATRTANESELSRTRQALLDSGEAVVTETGTVRFLARQKQKKHLQVRGGFVSYNLRGRQLRSVWRCSTRPFFPKSVGITDVEHLAVMSPDVARLCILAGTPEGGCCSECGKPRRRIIRRSLPEDTWEADCDCQNAETVPAVVLDPFGGAGTTLLIAKETGRSGLYIDLNPDYLRLAQARLANGTNRSVCSKAG